MTLINSIEEITSKKSKYQWILPLWVLFLIGTIILIFKYENTIIKSEKSYKTVVNINDVDVSFYKSKASAKRKLNKKDILRTLEYGQKYYLVDSIDSKWYQISVKGEIGIVKKSDCILDKTLIKETIVKRYSLQSENHKTGFAILIGILLISTVILKFYISKLRKVNLLYDEEAINKFEKTVEEFKQIINNNFVWVIASETKNHDLKNSSGAANSINRVEIKPSFDSLPYQNIVCNVKVPNLTINNIGYFFFPDVLLIVRSKEYELVEYKNLVLESNQSRFIETEKDTSNLTIDSYTYQYVNKDGSADQRHSYNPALPICLYSKYELIHDNNCLFKLMSSNSTIINPGINSNNTETELTNKEEYWSLIDDLKLQITKLYNQLLESSEVNEFLTKHSKEGEIQDYKETLQFCLLFDISKVYNLLVEEFGDNKIQKAVLLSISAELLGEDADFINNQSYDQLIGNSNNSKLAKVYSSCLGFGKNNNPINVSINNKKEEEIFSLPSILLLSNFSQSDEYSTFLYRLASVLTKSDNVVTPEEEKALNGIFKMLNPKSSQKTAKKKMDKKMDQPTLEAALKELNDMVGLEGVKQEVNSLINFVKIQKEREKHGLKQNDISYHCVFTGSPGTGKTTVARILANIFRSLDVIDTGQLVETDRAGMIAEYVGQTAVKVDKLVDESMGGVLFIDEAYSLSTGSSEDFGKEAIATLLKRMEDNRDNLIVIVAGYSDKMKDFIDMNPGLKSRFNRYIHFEDFAPKDMMSIYHKMCQGSDYTISQEAEKYLQSQFESAYNSRDESFGNGRYVRNAFEKSIENLSNRIAKSDKITKELLTTIEKEDINS
jgi:AAA+ superfamily predicted ATPase